MLTTNLLPQNEKRAVRLEELRRIVLFLGIGLIVVLCVGVVLLTPTYLFTLVEQQEFERSLALEHGVAGDTNTEAALTQMQTSRAVLTSLQKAAATSPKASLILDEIFSRSGPAISVQSVRVGTNDSIELRGHAETRRALLDFEETLRISETFQEISSPISNIVQETDITFTIEGNLESQYNF